MTRVGVSLAHLEAIAARLHGSCRHIRLFADLSERSDLSDRIRTLDVPVVIDHLGLIDPSRPISDPGFRALLALLRDGLCYVKLSGVYLRSRHPPPYPDVEPVAVALVEAAPDRLVWGTDWPHPSADERAPPDADVLAPLDRWAPDQDLRRRGPVDNSIPVYGFPEP
jgi:predicted TIM-barrel fold metal-dependent hydrolase